VNLRYPGRSGEEHVVIQGRGLNGNGEAPRSNAESGTALGAIVDIRAHGVEHAAVGGDVDHPAVEVFGRRLVDIVQTEGCR